MAMRFKPKKHDGTHQRTLTSPRTVDAGAHMGWVSAAKILRKKRVEGAKTRPKDYPDRKFDKYLAEEFPRWHGEIDAEEHA